MNEDEEVQFRWHQCSNCGKVFDSEEALHEHARRCKLDQVVVVGLRAATTFLRHYYKESGRRVGLGESLQGCLFVLKSTHRVA